tara:strand:+ start:324 stop:641 length:318 start_codon:yes stop_codon:yes gene_type:complete
VNVESYGYVVLTAAVGMGIVFLFLIILSLLMVVIRGVFGERPRPTAAAATGGETAATTDSSAERPADTVEQGVPRWVIAGALAYLAEEERDYAPQSQQWTQRSTR